ncbi:hypothetical protein [Acinetobacter baumannii]|uniref:hypothetical protein n=4 Tax=Acinetobacter baumannii TaxID=470 RepID=UPI00190233A0|nr:hypothetical protein [Acinetobacter baumannii]MBJ9912669.1 hypothetical protein [Acinetobacter baumannii]MBJ9947040.1 hypothetical protein [Acinetobacter baumannii]
MKFLKTVMIFSIGILVSSCGFSKENNQDIGLRDKKSLTENITQKSITQCKFEQGYIDFCSNENLKLYNDALNKKENFAQNKIALILDKDRDTGKGVPRKVKYFIVIDPKTKKVYPLEQSIGYFVNDRLEEIASEPPTIKFNQNSNKVCLSGTTFLYRDNNINVKNECYIFNSNDINYFKKVQKEKDVKNEKENLPVVFENNKFICNGIKCKETIFNNKKLEELSKNPQNNELRFLVSERGSNTTYINASLGNKVLYIFKYSEGDSEQEILYLSYFLNNNLKTKKLGEVKSFKVDSNQNVYFNGNKIILD